MDARPAHRLRLDGMLRELGACEPVDDGDDPVPAPTITAAGSTDIRAAGASADIRAAAAASDGAAESADRSSADSASASSDLRAGRPDSITIGELVDKAAHSGLGFLVAVLSLVAIPFVGLSTPFGLAIALVGMQLLIGRQRPWLPKRARARALRMHILDRILGIVNRRLRWLAASTRKRWKPLVTPRLVGLGVVLLGLGLALPLPIPGSNLIFIVPLLVYAIGLLEADGMWILIAHVATLVDIALVFAFGATVVHVLSRAWHWVF